MRHKRQLVTPAITLTPHIHTKQQLNNMTKKGLIRLVVKLEKFIIYHAYQMYKSKLPRLKTKRKFSRKQLAAQRLFAKRARAGTLRKRNQKGFISKKKAKSDYEEMLISSRRRKMAGAGIRGLDY